MLPPQGKAFHFITKLSNYFYVRRRGEEDIKMNFEEMGWGRGDYMVCINFGQDRSKWWSLGFYTVLEISTD